MADRDEKGRFLPGHSKGGPGRLPRVTEVQYLDSLKDAVPINEWTAACRAVLAKAKKGDVRAFEALAKYIMPAAPILLDLQARHKSEFRIAGITDEGLAAEMAREVVETFKLFSPHPDDDAADAAAN